MNTIAERIKFAMNVRNVKQVEMVQRTGITKGAFSSYLSGNYNPKKDKLELNLLNQNHMRSGKCHMNTGKISCKYLI